ncbi:PAS domain S-box-containing protein [Noviherbaspirillum humi]|uniref:histidine kinase n=1 Tax=Noviherbaspirillum humi TaxID=1688639 RepID=A0A239DRF7_9BURK|nr:response regulator [Noviherbaspirillum humi]SNS34322.1 PAS domain S-box-containing protein [Noviherbaspirillum humi]
MTTLTVLLVDDNPDDRALVARELEHHIAGVRVEHAGDEQALNEAIGRNRFDLVITDYRLRWSTGTEVLREMKRRFPKKPVIMFTGSGNEEVAVNAMKGGLDDYITKTVKHYPRIPYAVLSCVERARQREQLSQALERETLAKVRLEIALQSARMGTWQFDVQSNGIIYSDAIGPMFGQPEGFVHASFQHWLGDVHVDDQPAVMAAWDAAMAGGDDYQAQFRAIGADGRTRWIASSGKIIRDEGNAPKLVIGAARDVTDEVAARERTQRQQEELQTILDVLPVGIAISRDPEANGIQFTPYLAELLGVASGANVSSTGAGVADLPYRVFRDNAEVSPDDLPMQRAARHGIDVRGEELEMRLADGRSIVLLINTSPLRDGAGKVRGAVGALMDVTALKQTQHELEEANRQKTEFLSVLSHELRNPMAAIGYSIDLLRHVGSPEVISKARAVIERQTAHMGRLLDDLLDLSRITRNKIDLDMKPLDLRRVIELGYESAKPMIDPFSHDVVLVLAPEPILVQGDEVRLTQVLTNLLSNAGKFTPPGGRIEVKAFLAAGKAVVQVADNGIGIDPKKLDKVFEMFFQGQTKASGGATGLGIGLAVVHKLVTLHGGTVSAYSDGAGQGACFRMELPIQYRGEASPATLSEGEVWEAGNGRILVADDNVDAANLLSDVLRLDGYTVQTVYDGQSAIELSKKEVPDVAILDIGMPIATGNEVARWMRSQPWGGRVALIAATGWGQKEDRIATMEAGFDHHLVKPINGRKIARLVAEMLRQRRMGN